MPKSTRLDAECVNVVIAGVPCTVWRSGRITAHARRGKPTQPTDLVPGSDGRVSLACPTGTTFRTPPARIVLYAFASVPFDAVGTVAYANGDSTDLSAGNLSLLCGAAAAGQHRNRGWRADIFPPHLLALLARPVPAASVASAAKMLLISEERLARSVNDFKASNRETKIAEYLAGYSMIGRTADEPPRQGPVTVAAVDPTGLHPRPGETVHCKTALHTSVVPAGAVAVGGFTSAFGTRGGAERWVKMMVKSFAEIAAHLNTERAAALAQFLRDQS